jgi:hypothetical protein
MTANEDTNALKVLESIRASQFADRVTPEMLKVVYAVEHEKQFEDERGIAIATLRYLIVDAVEEES